ncbi:MAG: AmmeMemoRadiSam system protein B [Thermoplasmata archaeon]|nr:AmmeMemoRadiSam system protein B [Thermoplasmata archaeon]RLF69532.1 MAG: AmmeMemoRadiSam system protein B [Thermoplasmata archaeon]RLF69830.1 MAG: AmmeMemoRadiSam system protein B [Thermoplasmata archaeon]RLF70955.1 MAG: AmmeMemoRadiSam system protein B [Thermoplasmata archaeon]HDD60687.1 AmmeMemoRadiSam system protein B [Euryarchaeota archaeon]
MRQPAVAGQFYPATRGSLKRAIEESFLHPLGPTVIPEPPQRRIGKVIGTVNPHAGYVYSGPVAAHSVKAIVEDGIPPVVVFIGPNHTGYGAPVSLSTEDFKTPLGVIKNAIELSEALSRYIEVDELAHLMEHSIEVQMPFFQYFSSDFRIVPIVMGDQSFSAAKRVSEALLKVLEGVDFAIVASSDFTHCGFAYGQMPPPGVTAGEFAKEQDSKAIERILGLDPEGLYRVREEINLTMCGYGPVSVLMMVAKALGYEKAELLKYATSADIHPGDIAVGYCSIAFRRE